MRQSEGKKTLKRLDAVQRRPDANKTVGAFGCWRLAGGSVCAFPGGKPCMPCPRTGLRSPILPKTTLLPLAPRPMREASSSLLSIAVVESRAQSPMPHFRCKTIGQRGISNARKIPITIHARLHACNKSLRVLALALVSHARRVRHFRGFFRPEFRAIALGLFRNSTLFAEDSE